MDRRYWTPEENAQEYWFELVRKVLGKWQVKLLLEKLEVRELIDKFKTQVCCTITASNGIFQFSDTQVGDGVINALYGLIVDNIGHTYGTLKRIQIVDFDVHALIEQSHPSTSDPVEVGISVRNSRGESFYFRKESYSVVSASALAVLAAVEFFVNAEIAFLKCVSLVKDAQQRHRIDLVVKFTNMLSEIVKITDYSECVKSK